MLGLNEIHLKCLLSVGNLASKIILNNDDLHEVLQYPKQYLSRLAR